MNAEFRMMNLLGGRALALEVAIDKQPEGDCCEIFRI